MDQALCIAREWGVNIKERKFLKPINKNPIGSNQRYFSALRGLLLCIGIPDPWTRMLITPDSSYFGGIQSWTYQDFDFLYSPGQRLGMPRMRTCSLVTAWLTVSPGCAGVHTEKDSEKVAQHCTLVYHCHDCTLVNCAGVHTEKDSEKVAQHCAASSLCSV